MNDHAPMGLSQHGLETVSVCRAANDDILRVEVARVTYRFTVEHFTGAAVNNGHKCCTWRQCGGDGDKLAQGKASRLGKSLSLTVDHAQHHELVIAQRRGSAVDQRYLLIPAACRDLGETVQISLVGHRRTAALDRDRPHLSP